MMQKTIDELKKMSREDRLAYFNDNKESMLSIDDLDSVNGGVIDKPRNPDSEGIWRGCYYTSLGYVCRDSVNCG